MRKLPIYLMTAVAALTAPTLYAADAPDDGDELEGVEMDVMDADGTPNDASTKLLALPAQASETARERAQAGLDTANSAREDGAAFGQARAEQAQGTDHALVPPPPPAPPPRP